MGSGFEDDGSIIMCACSSDRGGCDRRFRLRYFRYYSTAGMVGADNGPPCPRSWCAAPDQPPRRDDSMKVHFRVPAAAARSHPTRPWRHQATERYFLVRTTIFFLMVNTTMDKCFQYQSGADTYYLHLPENV